MDTVPGTCQATGTAAWPGTGMRGKGAAMGTGTGPDLGKVTDPDPGPLSPGSRSRGRHIYTCTVVDEVPTKRS